MFLFSCSHVVISFDCPIRSRERKSRLSSWPLHCSRLASCPCVIQAKACHELKLPVSRQSYYKGLKCCAGDSRYRLACKYRLAVEFIIQPLLYMLYSAFMMICMTCSHHNWIQQLAEWVLVMHDRLCSNGLGHILERVRL